MLTCRQASQLVSESQERALGRRERWGLRLHLWICVSCRRFERQVRLLRRVLRRLARLGESDTQGPDLSPEARERIRQALAGRHDHRH
ncbi:MAG: zf-HC2 domain-containing protein [Gammaproteobacteria bacterium]|nr:zf-HC2 domain-containing protein [Gammaproteobacteria bacterium]